MSRYFTILLISSIFMCFLYKPFLPTTYNSVLIQSKKYVSVCKNTFNGRRMGNMMSMLAALLFVANKTRRVPVLPKDQKNMLFETYLANNLEKVDQSLLYNPTAVILAEKFGKFTYDPSFENPHSNKTVKNAKVLLICGYFQTTKYFTAVEKQVRKQLTFEKNISDSVKKYFEKNIKAFFANSTDVTTIGIHVRRGDFLADIFIRRGFSVVNEEYLELAINHHMKNSTSKYHLIFVATDGKKWVERAFNKISPKIIKKFELVISMYNPGFDMCLVSSCDRVIMSTGSFSWWVGLLANTSTVYYSKYPTKDSPLFKKFNKKDYYKAEWVGLPE